MQNRENAMRISDVMLREDELHAFCRELLEALLRYTGSQVGAVYLLDEQKTHFEHYESIGMSASSRSSFSALEREGEFGAVLASGRIQVVKNIPDDTHFLFRTVSGDMKPREIMTIPILSGQSVVAVISLASIYAYPESALRLMNDILSVMTARLNGVLAYRQIREFSEKLEIQNRELEAQKRELTVQTDELSEQNIELGIQKKQLDEANKLKSSFLSNMSHELRTPLNSVIALSSVLNRRLRGMIPDDEYSYIEVIERNGKHLLSLINDILDLSRIEAGREELHLSRFSVGELISDVVSMIEPQIREKKIELLNKAENGLSLMYSDFSKCRHILQNIVANAVKFTEKGRVEISAVLEDDSIRISVADTGIGIPADKLPYIFDEFRQADESTSRKYGGTGLGLSIAKKYAQLLQGTITVQSMPGEGSTFTLRLPVAIGLPGTAETAERYLNPAGAADFSSMPAGRGKCILLVEDSEPAIIQMKDILCGQGYAVRIAHNGKEALEQIEASLPDAMILDLMMPEVDGFQVLRAIRSAEKTSRIPVLILTAKHVTHEELSFLKGNNIYQLIQKGDISKTELLSAIGTMVHRTEEKRIHERPSPRPGPGGKPRILVVEDNKDNMKTVKALLEETCIVMEAADGRTGVELARSQNPDLILLDISLPDLDGYRVLDAIKREPALKETPVIALTARAMKGDREEIFSYGFDGYIPKPIDRELLEHTIREMLHG